MDRAEKKECVEELAAVFKSTSVVVVAHYSGLTVAQMQSLRKQMRAAGAQVQVAKNRLVKIALEGSEVASISGLMRGPTLIAYSSDPVAAAKVAVGFRQGQRQARDPRRRDGKDRVERGWREVARDACPRSTNCAASSLGLLQAPATKLAQLTTAPAAKLARVFAAYAEKDAA